MGIFFRSLRLRIGRCAIVATSYAELELDMHVTGDLMSTRPNSICKAFTHGEVDCGDNFVCLGRKFRPVNCLCQTGGFPSTAPPSSTSTAPAANRERTVNGSRTTTRIWNVGLLIVGIWLQLNLERFRSREAGDAQRITRGGWLAKAAEQYTRDPVTDRPK